MQMNKRALCAFDDKRYLLEDGIHTLAFGHYNIEEVKEQLSDSAVSTTTQEQHDDGAGMQVLRADEMDIDSPDQDTASQWSGIDRRDPSAMETQQRVNDWLRHATGDRRQDPRVLKFVDQLHNYSRDPTLPLPSLSENDSEEILSIVRSYRHELLISQNHSRAHRKLVDLVCDMYDYHENTMPHGQDEFYQEI